MNEIVTNIAVDVIAAAVEVAGGAIKDKSTGKSVNQHDLVIDDLKRQLDDARKVNQALCDYLKEVHNLTDDQVAKAAGYKPRSSKRSTRKTCPHCHQHVFSRNVATCFHCGGALRAVGSDV